MTLFRNIPGILVRPFAFLVFFFGYGVLLSAQTKPDKVRVTYQNGKATYEPIYPRRPDLPKSRITQARSLTPIIVTYTTTGATCNLNNGNVIASASGGTPPYLFDLGGIFVQNTGNFPMVSGGSYTLTVTDAGGQSTSVPVNVTNTFNSPQISISSYTPASDCGTADASVILQATGGTPPYQYSLDLVNYQTSNTFSNIYPGIYHLSVKDANGCVAVMSNFFQTFFLSPNCNMGLGVDYTYSSCTTEGLVHLSAYGPNGPYTFSLDGVSYSTDGYFTELGPGNYLGYFKDNFGVVQTLAIIILPFCNTRIDFIVVDAACGQNNGSLTVNASLGNPPYTYTIDGINYQTSNTFTGLAPGVYTVTVMDDNGVMNSSWTTVYDQCPEVTAVSTPAICGNNDGTITATGALGTPPYAYSIDGVNFQASNVFSSLSPGSYTVTVRDALMFTATYDVAVATNCLSIVATPFSATCGSNNGSISVTASNGTAPYLYSLDGVNFQSSNMLTNLSAGNYTITVRDGTGQTATSTVEVTDIPGPTIQLLATAASCLGNDGGLHIDGVGGTVPYQYSIDGSSYSGNNSINNLAPGTYTGWVMDNNGCVASSSLQVPLNDNLVVDAGADISICESGSGTLAGTSNGSIITWSPAAGLNQPGLIQPSASPAATTVYTLTGTLGICTKTDQVTVTVLPAPLANAGLDQTICYGQNASLAGTGGVDYQWTPSIYLSNGNIPGPLVVNPLETRTYSLVVKDLNGCSSLNNETVTIFVTPPAQIFAGNDTTIMIGQPFQLSARDINNSGFVSYFWTPSLGLNNNRIKDPITQVDQDMRYMVKATTAAGCEGTDEISIKVFKGPEIYVPTAFTPNNDGRNDLLKAIPVGISEFRYFKVFNRWGEEVFSTSDPGRGWDGRYKGRETGTNTFVWVAEGKDGNGNLVFRKGVVTIIY